MPVASWYTFFDVFSRLISEECYDLLNRQFDSAGKLAQVIDEDDAKWDAAIREWEEIAREIQDVLQDEFYSKGITSPSSRHL